MIKRKVSPVTRQGHREQTRTGPKWGHRSFLFWFCPRVGPILVYSDRSWLTCRHGMACLWLRSGKQEFHIPRGIWARWTCLVRSCYLGQVSPCGLYQGHCWPFWMSQDSGWMQTLVSCMKSLNASHPYLPPQYIKSAQPPLLMLTTVTGCKSRGAITQGYQSVPQ